MRSREELKLISADLYQEIEFRVISRVESRELKSDKIPGVCESLQTNLSAHHISLSVPYARFSPTGFPRLT